MILCFLLKRRVLSLCFLLIVSFYFAHAQSAVSSTKPKIVVGIVIDQMKWEYLRRFESNFSEQGAFKKMMKYGFECANTQYNYIPTVTAAGHASIYTGTTPAFHGIIGNDWYDRKKRAEVYCTDHPQTSEMSPDHLWSSTITDELRLSTQLKSRVYGIALKDRGAILPAGHLPNGAFWFDKKTGRWVSSSYYEQAEIDFLATYDAQKLVNQYYQKGWDLLKDRKVYVNQPLHGDGQYYNHVFGSDSSFPYQLSQYIGKDYNKILTTPWGNSLTIALAKEVIETKKLGSSAFTDFLAISFSSTDYVGHAFGPNSLELEDTYLRLDEELGVFISYLEKKFGKDVLFFITADHGVSPIPQVLQARHFPAKSLDTDSFLQAINKWGKKEFYTSKLVLDMVNAQLYLNFKNDTGKSLNPDKVIEKVKRFLLRSFDQELIFVVNNHHLAEETLPEKLQEQLKNGFTPTRSGDVSLVFRPHFFSQYDGKGTTHFSPYHYDTHVPLLFYGWGIPKGRTMRQTNITDIAVTLSFILGIEEPNSATGNVIHELFKSE